MTADTPRSRIESLHVRLHDVRLSACIGVLEQERVVASDFVVNLDLEVLCADDAVFADRLSATVDYSAAYALVCRLMRRPYQLIERAAGAIGQALLDAFPQVERLSVDIRKVNPPMGAASAGASVCVTLVRNAQSA